jgi:hypothetical protein
MHRHFTLVVCSFLAVALLWRSYVPPTNAAEARNEDAAAEGNKDVKAQGLDDKSRATKVATLDLAGTFKVHRGYLERTAQMKKDVAVAEEALKVRQNAVARMNDKLATLAKNSDEHRALAIEIVRAANELKTDAELKKKEFMEKESRIYIEVLDEVMAHVRTYAVAHQIGLVMRTSRGELDRSDPQEVLKELNKSILYDAGVDITADIIALVNGK